MYYRCKKSGQAAGHYQKHRTYRICSQRFACQYADRCKDLDNSAVQHKLRNNKRNDKEHRAKNILFWVPPTALESHCPIISPAPVSDREEPSASAPIKRSVISRGIAWIAFLRSQCVAENHQDTPDSSNHPSIHMKLCGKKQTDNRQEKDRNADFIGNEDKGLPHLSPVFIFLNRCCICSIRHELRCKEKCPDRHDNKQRPFLRSENP